MTWHEGHQWSLDTQLPGDSSLEFKVVMVEDSGHTRWEEGDNRTLVVPATTACGHAALPVGDVAAVCSWGDVSGTSVTARPDRQVISAQLDAAEARVAALRQKRRRGEQRAAAVHMLADSAPAALPALSSATSPAASSSNGSMLKVPILNPSELPPINSSAASAFQRLADEVVGAPLVVASGGSSSSAEVDAPQPAAVGERVLAETCDRLLAAARAALASRESVSVGAVALGSAECDLMRATALLQELLVRPAASRGPEGGLWGPCTRAVWQHTSVPHH